MKYDLCYDGFLKLRIEENTNSDRNCSRFDLTLVEYFSSKYFIDVQTVLMAIGLAELHENII